MAALATGPSVGSQSALALASQALRQGGQATAMAVAPLELRLRVLAEGLYQTARMKLSVPLYGVCMHAKALGLCSLGVG